eukprot:gnl/TRDRNA2_/TRDRNA2_70132_c0_seq1.p1 gnl/TRDRNA2_/TRDRNA2_70132_c0~~gnl/TRDRNA2_/TRDRNA2_70132_c0_seq1.p1  ORF type:complete len:247 (+),score=27.46 gnl/TRDRNA2_/TRDRNA2_70132_c0_seq1:65-742(+)
MPRENKHLAFDPRYYHGVIGKLGFNEDSNQTKLRKIIGVNFWESRTHETMRNNPLALPLIPPSPNFRRTVPEKSEHTSTVTSTLQMQGWSDECGGTEDMQTTESTEERVWIEQVVEGRSFKEGHATSLWVRFPATQMNTVEKESRGQNFQFKIGCNDVNWTSATRRHGMQQLSQNVCGEGSLEEFSEQALKIVKGRCKMFKHTLEAMNPSAAAAYCRKAFPKKEL